MRTEAFLSYKMTTADANNPEGVIPVGRQFDFIGDVETELMILNDGDESLCLGYNDVKFMEDAYVGDQLDFKATMVKVGNTSRTRLLKWLLLQKDSESKALRMEICTISMNLS